MFLRPSLKVKARSQNVCPENARFTHVKICFTFLHYLFVPCHLHRLEQVNCKLWESVRLCLKIVFKNMTKFNNTRKPAELPTRLGILHRSFWTRLIFCQGRALWNTSPIDRSPEVQSCTAQEDWIRSCLLKCSHFILGS